MIDITIDLMNVYGSTMLVGGMPTPQKNVTSSVAIPNFPTEGNFIKFMFQSTKQDCMALKKGP